MTKQQVIDILEYFRPSRDKYCPSPVDDYVDDMIDRCIDNIIEFVKREPDNEWIECRKKMPENGKSVLVVTENNGYSWIDIGYIDEAGYWTIDGEIWDKKSDPAITHWMLLPELPEVEQ